MLRVLTAGESHGKALVALIEGLPAGLQIDKGVIDDCLRLRQSGYGRGGRMTIENDTVDILSGCIHGTTIGSPLALLIRNKDYKLEKMPKFFTPRPGHADLAGMLKYEFDNARPVLERASARETAARVVAGAVCKQLLAHFSIHVAAYVDSIGGIQEKIQPDKLPFSEIQKRSNASSFRMLSTDMEEQIKTAIDTAQENGVSLGGTVTIIADGVPVGLGSHAQWDRKLDARLGAALLSIQSVKAVEFGLGFGFADRKGAEVLDEITYDANTSEYKKRGYGRTSNMAGGIEGGISNGERIVIRCCFKPIPTQKKGMKTVDVRTKETVTSDYERSDTCVAPAASIVADCVVCTEIAAAFLEKFAGDSIAEITRSIRGGA